MPTAPPVLSTPVFSTPVLATPRSNDELQSAIQAVFDRWDVDRSGLLSLSEFAEGISREARSPEYRDDPSVRLVASAIKSTSASMNARMNASRTASATPASRRDDEDGFGWLF